MCITNMTIYDNDIELSVKIIDCFSNMIVGYANFSDMMCFFSTFNLF